MATTSDHWLVRTADNLIAGPYTREQVCTLIRDGQLTHQDEVCHASGYWITLHERDEVRKQLGIEVPRAAGSPDEEVTETQTEALERTDDAIPTLEAAVAQQAQAPAVQDADSHTSFVSPDMLRGLPGHAAASPQALSSPAAGRKAGSRVRPAWVGGELSRGQGPLGQIERPSFWRGFAWILALAVAAVALAVIRLLRSGQGQG